MLPSNVTPGGVWQTVIAKKDSVSVHQRKGGASPDLFILFDAAWVASIVPERPSACNIDLELDEAISVREG